MWFKTNQNMYMYLVYLFYLCFWVLGLTRLLTSLGHLPEVQGYDVWCHVDVNQSWSFKTNHGNAMACSMLCLVYWLLFLSSFLVWSWDVCVWDSCLNHFWVIDQLYLDYFLVSMMGLKYLFWSWWFHVVTC